MVGSNYLYQMMVVTNLPCFKSPKQKDTDNVQFTVMKKIQDFEELHTKLNTKFSGTVLPTLPKKVLKMNDSVAKERRNNLDHFVKFLACTPKICSDPMVLAFLGASSSRIKTLTVSDREVEGGETTGDTTNVLGEEETNDEAPDLFDTGTGTGDVWEEEEEEEEENLFGTKELSFKTNVSTKIFEDLDLEGALHEGEHEELFVTGAKSEGAVTMVSHAEDQGEAADLFGSDDDNDIDEIMNMKLTSDDKTDEAEAETTPYPDTVEHSHEHNPELLASREAVDSTEVPLKPKPALKQKPSIPAKRTGKDQSSETIITTTENLSTKTDQSNLKPQMKPKPAIGQKPVTSKKPDLAEKPGLPQKPALKPKPSKSESEPVPDNTQDTVAIETLTEDSIMKYIEANANTDDDLDLFS
ncbi:HCLS1-binding protein 3-like isoform X2 [Dreissena polymorpha]|nr:HCLS1-binding protein 3-like isoform X2 [Dreissena polymorpha]